MKLAEKLKTLAARLELSEEVLTEHGSDELNDLENQIDELEDSITDAIDAAEGAKEDAEIEDEDEE